MSRVTKSSNSTGTPYASCADFHLTFLQNMDSLYLLSFLLNGDHPLAEQCFVRGLEKAQESKVVFKDRAKSWARRAMIQSAIQAIRPRANDSLTRHSACECGVDRAGMYPREIGDVLELTQFERFVFVMSVLERYSCLECSLLLGCSQSDVKVARVAALRRIGRAAQARYKVENATPGDHVRRNSSDGVSESLRIDEMEPAYQMRGLACQEHRRA